MVIRRHLAGLAALCACAIVLQSLILTPAAAQVVAPALATVLREAAPDDELSVIVTFEPAADLDQIRDPKKPARRSKIIRALQDNYAQQAGGHERFLRGRRARRVVPLWIINGMAVTASADTIRELARRPGVASIRPDLTIEGPEKTPAEAGPAEWNLAAIRAPDLGDMGYTGAGVVIANIDTGVDPDHPDYKDKWRGGANSWYDPFGQYASPHDNTTGHGTQVNGILVGGDAGGSSIGVAPGAQWIAARIFDDDNRSSFGAIHLALQWVLDPDRTPGTDDAPDIVNNSWGLRDDVGECVTEFLPDVRALRAAQIAVVFAAGNAGPNPNTSISPANYSESFAVGSVDASLNVEYTSGRGPGACDGSLYPQLVAPGVNVRTTDLTFGGLFPDSYRPVTGTSFAAPHVSGAMALLLSAFPDAPVERLEKALQRSAIDIGPRGLDNDAGAGMVDVMAAYEWLRLHGVTAVSADRYQLYR